MESKYWLDLFTGKTWEEFLKQGATISGFRERRKKTCMKIKPGDFFLCYLTGVSRFVGILEVKSEMYFDKTPLWKDEDFPCRFKVELIHSLNPETAIPILEFKDNLPLFQNLKYKNSWTGFFRGSPVQFSKENGDIILNEIVKNIANPIIREYDEKKYWRKPKTYDSKLGVVTVPDPEPEEEENDETSTGYDIVKTTHEEIQWRLLKLGSDLGLDVWVAKNDKNKEFNGNKFQTLKNLRHSLPIHFDKATNKTIELIDVLWFQGGTIIAAFEVEHTSAIYSGLLRMSDLISMQPNIKINLYIVAPDERRDKVFYEINRPTFSKLKPSLPKICKYIPYSILKNEIDQLGEKISYMKPDFINMIAESCETDEA